MSDIFDVVVTGALNLESIDGDPLELGGGGINAAVASVKFVPTKLIGCLGTDVNLEAFRYIAAKTGVDCSGIEFISGKTFRWFIKYSQDKASILEEIHEYGDYHNMLPNPEPFRTKVLLMSTGHPKLQNIVLRAACADSIPEYVLLDTKGVHIKERFEQLFNILTETNIFFATEEEIRLLLKYEITGTIRKIFNSFSKLYIIIIKRHSKGGQVLLRDGTAYYYYASAPGEVIDPTGAGDVFAGAFAGLLSQRGVKAMELLQEIIQGAAEAATTSVVFKGQKKFIRSDTPLSQRPVVKIEMLTWE